MTDVERPLLFVYVIAAIAVALVGARYLQAKEPEASPLPRANQSFMKSPTASTGGTRIVVHVAGAVNQPGVISLPDGARAADAIRRAGGFSRGGDRGGLNLAAKLADGQQIVVPSRTAHDQSSASPGGPDASNAKVSLNGATAAQLDELDGIGPGLAAKIIAARTERGGFSSIDDLADVPGIGEKRLEALRSQLQP